MVCLDFKQQVLQINKYNPLLLETRTIIIMINTLRIVSISVFEILE